MITLTEDDRSRQMLIMLKITALDFPVPDPRLFSDLVFAEALEHTRGFLALLRERSTALINANPPHLHASISIAHDLKMRITYCSIAELTHATEQLSIAATAKGCASLKRLSLALQEPLNKLLALAAYRSLSTMAPIDVLLPKPTTQPSPYHAGVPLPLPPTGGMPSTDPRD